MNDDQYPSQNASDTECVGQCNNHYQVPCAPVAEISSAPGQNCLSLYQDYANLCWGYWVAGDTVTASTAALKFCSTVGQQCTGCTQVIARCM